MKDFDFTLACLGMWSPLFRLHVLRTCVDHGPLRDRGMSKTELLVLKDAWSRKGTKLAWRHLWSKESDMHTMGSGGAVIVARVGSGKDSLFS